MHMDVSPNQSGSIFCPSLQQLPSTKHTLLSDSSRSRSQTPHTAKSCCTCIRACGRKRTSHVQAAGAVHCADPTSETAWHPGKPSRSSGRVSPSTRRLAVTRPFLRFAAERPRVSNRLCLQCGTGHLAERFADAVPCDGANRSTTQGREEPSSPTRSYFAVSADGLHRADRIPVTVNVCKRRGEHL